MKNRKNLHLLCVSAVFFACVGVLLPSVCFAEFKASFKSWNPDVSGVNDLLAFSTTDFTLTENPEPIYQNLQNGTGGYMAAVSLFDMEFNGYLLKRDTTIDPVAGSILPVERSSYYEGDSWDKLWGTGSLSFQYLDAGFSVVDTPLDNGRLKVVVGATYLSYRTDKLRESEVVVDAGYADVLSHAQMRTGVSADLLGPMVSMAYTKDAFLPGLSVSTKVAAMVLMGNIQSSRLLETTMSAQFGDEIHSEEFTDIDFATTQKSAIPGAILDIGARYQLTTNLSFDAGFNVIYLLGLQREAPTDLSAYTLNLSAYTEKDVVLSSFTFGGTFRF